MAAKPLIISTSTKLGRLISRAVSRVLGSAIGVAILVVFCAVLLLAMPQASPEVAGRVLKEATVRAIEGTDERLSSCPGASEDAVARATLEFSPGSAYRKVFPRMGISPELDEVEGPVAAVIYAGPYPGPIYWNPDHVPDERARLEPGAVDICVVTPTGERFVYGKVPLEGFSAP